MMQVVIKVQTTLPMHCLVYLSSICVLFLLPSYLSSCLKCHALTHCCRKIQMLFVCFLSSLSSYFLNCTTQSHLLCFVSHLPRGWCCNFQTRANKALSYIKKGLNIHLTFAEYAKFSGQRTAGLCSERCSAVKCCCHSDLNKTIVCWNNSWQKQTSVHTCKSKQANWQWQPAMLKMLHYFCTSRGKVLTNSLFLAAEYCTVVFPWQAAFLYYW